MTPFQLSAGRPHPLGATFDGEGVNFAIFSQHATRVVLCLCDDQGREAISSIWRSAKDISGTATFRG